jgi:hypothetical protein
MNDDCISIVSQALECLIENHMLTFEEGNSSPNLIFESCEEYCYLICII